MRVPPLEPLLTSRKIYWVIEKWWNFHTVNSETIFFWLKLATLFCTPMMPFPKSSFLLELSEKGLLWNFRHFFSVVDIQNWWQIPRTLFSKQQTKFFTDKSDGNVTSARKHHCEWWGVVVTLSVSSIRLKSVKPWFLSFQGLFCSSV